jgi:hypothetical protein
LTEQPIDIPKKEQNDHERCDREDEISPAALEENLHEILKRFPKWPLLLKFLIQLVVCDRQLTGDLLLLLLPLLFDSLQLIYQWLALRLDAELLNVLDGASSRCNLFFVVAYFTVQPLDFPRSSRQTLQFFHNRAKNILQFFPPVKALPGLCRVGFDVHSSCNLLEIPRETGKARVRIGKLLEKPGFLTFRPGKLEIFFLLIDVLSQLIDRIQNGLQGQDRGVGVKWTDLIARSGIRSILRLRTETGGNRQ